MRIRTHWLAHISLYWSLSIEDLYKEQGVDTSADQISQHLVRVQLSDDLSGKQDQW